MERLYNITNFELKYKKYKSKYANNKKKMNNMIGGDLIFRKVLDKMTSDRSEIWKNIKQNYESELINVKSFYDESQIRESDQIIANRLSEIGNAQGRKVVSSSPKNIIPPSEIDIFCIMHYSNPELIKKWKQFASTENSTKDQKMISLGYVKLREYVFKNSSLVNGNAPPSGHYINYDGIRFL